MDAVFPNMANSGTAKKGNGGRIEFSYLDSYGRAVTASEPTLDAKGVLKLVKERMARFASAPPGARESDASRSDRKWISAQPASVLRQAWSGASNGERMELSMMLDEVSHHGISDPAWLAEHARPQRQVPSDDGPLDRPRLT